MSICRLNFAVLGITLGALATLTTQVWAAHDEIILRTGAPTRGKVTKDDVTGVVVRTQGGNLTFNANQIKEIRFDVSNGEYLRGLREMKRGAYRSASESFAILTDKESLRTLPKIVRPYVLFLHGESLYKAGQTKEAMKALQLFLKDYPTSRYIDGAVASLVDAAIQMKAYQIVPALLEKLKKSGRDAKAKALYYEGKMKLAQGDVAAANEKYGQAAGSAVDKETKALSKLGQAECAIRKKDFGTAKSMAEEALRSSGLPAVAGTAHMIVGEVLFMEGDKLKGDPAKEKYLDAVLEFMRIPVSYGGDPRTEPKALFLAGECFRRLAKFPKRSKDRRRAATMYSTVLKRYGGSSWAKKAQDSMKKVR